mmetsp:Transcript_18877/g.21629  ORF Transcript_18877/g.21629 Transcript_18877/m.21629 type:complete len:348 (+) Transcript_18877:31-1074(+)|eukprot:CAMPEP_0194181314 /NCGR_PEP_ID=MMETSP0154-20130528/20042_1 /TAXON_ID=1049557 /ORGANISM="Thalassiothrix antarctica, Strain L6-D1" /LENGTH=347 /DNA_ID=CAMNT_0038897251 /DNA_START=9 /DNA_END=1052 /DNA_ORIENTATION=-
MGCGFSIDASSSKESKIIAVLGARGLQGGALCDALNRHFPTEFKIRAITRDKSKLNSGKYGEVVEADLDDLASLQNAFKGAYGVFGLTNFWESFSAAKEKEQARNIAQACKNAGVKHCVWSTLEYTVDTLKPMGVQPLQGDYTVPHFDAKFEANQFFSDLGVPTTYLYTCMYMENLINPATFLPKDHGNGLMLGNNMADEKLPLVCTKDIGIAAAMCFGDPDTKNTSQYIASDVLTMSEIAAIYTEVVGKQINYVPFDDDTFRSMDFPGAAELSNMFQFMRENANFKLNRNLSKMQELCDRDKLTTLRDFLTANKEKIPFESKEGAKEETMSTKKLATPDDEEEIDC